MKPALPADAHLVRRSPAARSATPGVDRISAAACASSGCCRLEPTQIWNAVVAPAAVREVRDGGAEAEHGEQRRRPRRRSGTRSRGSGACGGRRCGSPICAVDGRNASRRSEASSRVGCTVSAPVVPSASRTGRRTARRIAGSDASIGPNRPTSEARHQHRHVHRELRRRAVHERRRSSCRSTFAIPTPSDDADQRGDRAEDQRGAQVDARDLPVGAADRLHLADLPRLLADHRRHRVHDQHERRRSARARSARTGAARTCGTSRGPASRPGARTAGRFGEAREGRVLPQVAPPPRRRSRRRGCRPGVAQPERERRVARACRRARRRSPASRRARRRLRPWRARRRHVAAHAGDAVSSREVPSAPSTRSRSPARAVVAARRAFCTSVSAPSGARHRAGGELDDVDRCRGRECGNADHVGLHAPLADQHPGGVERARLDRGHVRQPCERRELRIGQRQRSRVERRRRRASRRGSPAASSGRTATAARRCRCWRRRSRASGSSNAARILRRVRSVSDLRRSAEGIVGSPRARRARRGSSTTRPARAARSRSCVT